MNLEDKIKLPHVNPRLCSKEIGDFIIKTIEETNATGAVVGLSGGADSTHVAIEAKKAIDKYNLHNDEKKELVGYIVPSKENSPNDTKDGIEIAERLGIRYEIINIERIVERYIDTNEPILNPNDKNFVYHKENLISRVRGNVLNTKAAIEDKVLLGTGNHDEDFSLGYFTLYGDGAVHCSPIGNLPKRIVKEMLVYHGYEKTAKRIPTAGLRKNQTDFIDLGYSYESAEIVLRGFYQGIKVEELHKNKEIKKQIIPELKDSKYSLIIDIVENILYRHNFKAKPKMAILHPPAASITFKYR